MALTKSLSRLDHPTLQTTGEGREPLLALSQRKLNALGLPVCYIDRDQRYRFVNRAFLDWTGKSRAEVLGREIIEVDGRELYQLYRAYIDAALSGERTGFERQLSSRQRNAVLDPRRLLPRPQAARATSAASSPPTPTSTTSSGWSSRPASASTGCASSPTASGCRSSISTAR